MTLCVCVCGVWYCGMEKGSTFFPISERDVTHSRQSHSGLRLSALVICTSIVSNARRKETHATLHFTTHAVLAPPTVSLPSYQHVTS